MLKELRVNLAPQIKCLIVKELRVKLAALALYEISLDFVGHVLEEMCLMLKELRVKFAPKVKCLMVEELRVKFAPKVKCLMVQELRVYWGRRPILLPAC